MAKRCTWKVVAKVPRKGWTIIACTRTRKAAQRLASWYLVRTGRSTAVEKRQHGV